MAGILQGYAKILVLHRGGGGTSLMNWTAQWQLQIGIAPSTIAIVRGCR